LEESKAHAQAIIKTLKPFSFPLFEKKFAQKPLHHDLFKDSCQRYIDQLKKQGRTGSAVCHETAMHSLYLFKSKIALKKSRLIF
jgi:hypothetical protein